MLKKWSSAGGLLLPVIAILMFAIVRSGTSQEPKGGQRDFTGSVRREEGSAAPRPVRNAAAQAGSEIVTLRYFRIKKGSFPEFLKVSSENVWPYFDKLGARVVGMWQVIAPENIEGLTMRENPDYDEVYLSTRYASLEHWKASREPVRHGGDGPDWQKCKAGLDRRAELTLSTNVIFLQGQMATNGPYFMPGLDETYVAAPGK